MICEARKGMEIIGSAYGLFVQARAGQTFYTEGRIENLN